MPVSKKPDYDFWGQMSGWNVTEGAALLLDIDPDNVPEKTDNPDDLGFKYHRLLRLLKRARAMEELESPMYPRDFLTWASSNRITPPEELVLKVRAGKPHRNWKTRYRAIRKERDELKAKVEGLEADLADTNLPARAKTTLLRLVGGMARAKFGHASNVRGTAKKIEDALDLPSVHWHVANNAIKGWLDAADALYDEEHPKNSNEF